MIKNPLNYKKHLYPSVTFIAVVLLFMIGDNVMAAKNSNGSKAVKPIIVPDKLKVSSAEPLAVPTFECIGLCWKPAEAARDNMCEVSYRVEGESIWKEGFPLWFDPTDHPELPERSKEYRGSIVHLKPATTYEIKLKLKTSGTEKMITAKTWDEKFPITKTVQLSPNGNEAIIITEGGSRETGYVLYEPAPGSVFDVDGKADANANVKASYVILKGFTFKGGKIHGVQLMDVQDVVIENCDISGWGETLEDGYGANLNSAIYSKSQKLERVIIQNCKLHHPRSNSNSWAEPRKIGNEKNPTHPNGPQGISFLGGKGHYVIRHNQIFSDDAHKFNDGMGEVKNKTVKTEFSRLLDQQQATK